MNYINSYILERTAEPSQEPVTLAELKTHLRIATSVTDEDTELTNLIIAGREWVEDFTGRALVDQTWKLTINQSQAIYGIGDRVTGFRYGFYSGDYIWERQWEIPLRKSPVLEISSFVSVDDDGTETAIDATSYELRESTSRAPRIAMINTTVSPLTMYRITFRAGYCNLDCSPAGTTADIPERYKQAIKLWVEATYDRDATMMPLLLKTAEQLVRGERCELGIA